MKRAISFLLVLALLLSAASALADTAFPLTEEPATLRALARTPSYFPGQVLARCRT
ncbi:MAG: hypothetical protein IJ214_11805 [Clostridia bacterium]|nr:hypothetical protein [Clostridia bacterium]